MSAPTPMPEVGREYHDEDGRVLRVHSVKPGDRLGREVVGTLRRPGVEDRDYSTTLALWEVIWYGRPGEDFES